MRLSLSNWLSCTGTRSHSVSPYAPIAICGSLTASLLTSIPNSAFSSRWRIAGFSPMEPVSSNPMTIGVDAGCSSESRLSLVNGRPAASRTLRPSCALCTPLMRTLAV